MTISPKHPFTDRSAKTVRLSLALAVLSLATSSNAFCQSAQSDIKTGQAVTSSEQHPSAMGIPPDQSDSEAAKNAAQNPVAPAIDLPFQNNTYYGVGPYRRAENVLLVEPVVPFKLSSKLALITRTLIPVVVVPRLSPTNEVDYGLGNIQPQFYLTSTHPGKLIYAVGGELWLPTATDRVLGINKWGGGPGLVAVVHPGHWLGGFLVNNEFAGVNHIHVSELTLNPFLFFNMPRGWYFVTSPIMTADWTASRSHRWTVPAGGGVGRVFMIGTQAVNARTQFLNDVRTTYGGSDWQLQTQIQLIFVQKKKKE